MVLDQEPAHVTAGQLAADPALVEVDGGVRRGRKALDVAGTARRVQGISTTVLLQDGGC